MPSKDFLAVLDKVREPEGDAGPSALPARASSGSRQDFSSLLQKVRDPNFEAPAPVVPPAPEPDPSIFDRVKGVGRDYLADLKTISSALPMNGLAEKAAGFVRSVTPNVVPSVPSSAGAALKEAAAPLVAPGQELTNRLGQMEKAERPLKKDAEYIRSYIADYVSGTRGPDSRGGSREEIFARAAQTGKISYKDIANRTIGELIAENIPLTPTEIGVAAMFPRALNFAAGTLAEAAPVLTRSMGEIGRALKEFATTKKIEVPITSEQIKDFYIFGREKLNPKTYEILVKMEPDALKAMAKAGKGGAAEVRVPRFGAEPEPSVPAARGVPAAGAAGGGPLATTETPTRAQFAQDLGQIRAGGAITPPAAAEAIPGQGAAAPTRAGFMEDLGKARAGEVAAEAPSAAPMESRVQAPGQPAEIQPGLPAAKGPASTEASLQAPVETSPGTPKLRDTVFQPPTVPYASSVARHPDFVKLTNDATAVVEKYAKERGVAPTPELAKSIWQQMHDESGMLRYLPKEQQLEAIKALQKKYPDFDAEFSTLGTKLKFDATVSSQDAMQFYFDRWVKGRSGALRPKSGTEAEAPASPPETPGGKQGLMAPADESTQGLSSRNWQVEMPKEPTGKGTINKLQIMDFAEKAFDVPIRSKLTHRMMKEAGHFEVYQRLIRLKKWGELEVLMHEVGHAQDQAIEKVLGKKWKTEQIPADVRKEAVSELRNLDYDQKKRRLSEGFAEYMRYWMTTDQATAKAPVFHKVFNDILMAKNPELKAKMEKMKSLYSTYVGQGAENRVLSQIDFKGEIKHDTPLKEKAVKAVDWFKTHWIDEFWTIKKIEGELGKESRKTVPPTKSAFEMATFVKQKANGIARTFVEQGAVDEFGNIVGPSLEEVLKPIKRDQMKSFIAYGAAKRALLLSKRGIESGLDIEDARFIVDKFKSEAWDKAVEGLTKWSDQGMDWLVRAGALSPQEKMIIQQLNPIYLPFKRVFVDEVELGGKGAGGAFDSGSPLKKIHGSGRPIKNPLESLISQMTEMIAKAHKMRVASLITDWTRYPAAGKHIVEIPAPLKATHLSMDQVTSQLKAMGVDLADVDMDKIMTVFSQSATYAGKGNVVSLWRNGHRKFYELSPELYKALQGVDDVHLNSFLLKPLILFARLQRLGATGLKASFGLLRNPFRDALTYTLFSKRRTATIFDPLKGIYKDLTSKPGDLASRFKAAGGELSNPIGYDRAATMAIYDEMLVKKLPHGKALMIVKHPVDALRRLFQIPEMGPRIAELGGSYEKYKKEHPEWSEEDVFVAAFNDAQDVTLNFTRSGRHGKVLNQMVAFFNAGMQGLSKTARATQEDPVGVVVKGLAWITSAALWSWNKNKDRQWYKNLDPAYKYNNLFFEVGQEIYRLPLPFELGLVFASVPMAVADSIHQKNPKFLKGLYGNLGAALPSVVPTAFQPAIDVMRNKDFLGRPIESEGMKYLPPEERKRYYTSEIAKNLSAGFNKLGINISPVQLDYMLWNYTGGLPGQFKLDIKELSDVPVLGDVMVRTPEKPTRQLNEFFNELTTLSQKKAADKISGPELGRLVYMETFRTGVYKIYNDQIKAASEKGDVKKVRELYGKLADAFDKAGF